MTWNLTQWEIAALERCVMAQLTADPESVRINRLSLTCLLEKIEQAKTIQIKTTQSKKS